MSLKAVTFDDVAWVALGLALLLAGWKGEGYKRSVVPGSKAPAHPFSWLNRTFLTAVGLVVLLVGIFKTIRHIV
jgi:hypothetical protein